MRYVSTRGTAPVLDFGEALLEQLLGLPMAFGKILADALVFHLGLFVGQR